MAARRALLLALLLLSCRATGAPACEFSRVWASMAQRHDVGSAAGASGGASGDDGAASYSSWRSAGGVGAAGAGTVSAVALAAAGAPACESAAVRAGEALLLTARVGVDSTAGADESVARLEVGWLSSPPVRLLATRELYRSDFVRGGGALQRMSLLFAPPRRAQAPGADDAGAIALEARVVSTGAAGVTVGALSARVFSAAAYSAAGARGDGPRLSRSSELIAGDSPRLRHALGAAARCAPSLTIERQLRDGFVPCWGVAYKQTRAEEAGGLLVDGPEQAVPAADARAGVDSLLTAHLDVPALSGLDAGAPLATVEVVDARAPGGAARTLATALLYSSHVDLSPPAPPLKHRRTRVTLPALFATARADAALDFRVRWHGFADVNVRDFVVGAADLPPDPPSASLTPSPSPSASASGGASPTTSPSSWPRPGGIAVEGAVYAGRPRLFVAALDAAVAKAAAANGLHLHTAGNKEVAAAVLASQVVTDAAAGKSVSQIAAEARAQGAADAAAQQQQQPPQPRPAAAFRQRGLADRKRDQRRRRHGGGDGAQLAPAADGGDDVLNDMQQR